MALTLTGGVITTFTSGAVNYKSHTFTSSANLTITGTGTQAVQLLVVGGGGGGAMGGGGESNATTRGNGGGGGGLYYTGSYVVPATYPTWSITVGAGGRGGYYFYDGGISANNGGVTTLLGGPAATASVNATFGDGGSFKLTGSIATLFYVTSSTTQVDANPVYYVVTGSTAAITIANIITKIRSISDLNVLATGSGNNLLLTSSFIGTTGNSFSYTSASVTTQFGGGANTVSLTGSYGGYGGQPQGGDGGSGGGGNPTGSAIFRDSGSAGGLQGGRSGAGGGGATAAGSPASSTWNAPFLIWNGGDGGAGKAYTLQDGTTEYYAAGGGGGGDVNIGPGAGGTGGSNIGGNGGYGSTGAGGNGVANTGAGGGGGALSDQSSNWGSGGNGGSGIVVITYTV